MALSIVALSMLILARCAQPVSADAFLRAEADESRRVTKEEIEQLLLSGLSGFTDNAHLHSAKEGMRVMYDALPKGENGKLEPSTVRYALHRYFVQKHGWYLTGLSRADRSNQSWSSGSAIMKHRAPALMLQMLSGGLGLHELAVVAVTLSDLIHAEAVGQLEKIFAGLQLPLDEPLSSTDSDLAVKAYLLEYVNDDWNDTWANASHVESEEQEAIDFYPGYNNTNLWLQDFRKSFAIEQKSRRNPFVQHPETFSSTVAFVQEFGHRFGLFQDLECRAQKGLLLKRDPSATGRVHLSDFYSFKGARGKLFIESAAYLRNLGALDETDPRNPRVMIANYLVAPANCLSTTSSFYSVCCRNECNGLAEQLETAIASPSATPARIAEVVSRIRSDTVDAPRNLSASLLARLDEIADFNEGLVPLHGRLFSQWMHHAYPRECPFPQVAGAEEPMTLDEWINAGRWHEATEKEVLFWTKEGEAAKGAAVPMELPWITEEELVVEPERWTASSLQAVMAFAALLSFAAPLVRAAVVAASDVLTEQELEMPSPGASKVRVAAGGRPGAKPGAKLAKRKLEEAVL